jgi:hypothetical protein
MSTIAAVNQSAAASSRVPATGLAPAHALQRFEHRVGVVANPCEEATLKGLGHSAGK